MKIIVVGAVAGGATAASQIKRELPDAEIVIYEKDRDMSFANCGLPYYIGNVLDSREELLHFTPESFEEKKAIKVNVYHEVTRVNTEQQTVTIYNHQTKETLTDHYDKLILSPGCRAVSLDAVKAADNAFHIRNVMDIDAIDEYMAHHSVQNALVIGAGYISIEMVENLKHRGLDVTLVHRSEHLLKTMDKKYVPRLKTILEDQNIQLQLNDEVAAVKGCDVTFKSGHSAAYDLIIEAVGIQPNTQFLKDSGIELNDKGYIKTNEYFETSADHVYALGDAIETYYRHTGEKTTVALAWGAHRAANLIAGTIAGQRVPFKGLLGTNIVQIFDHSIASIGISEEELKHYDYETVSFEQRNHAGYMPDAQSIAVSVHYRTDNRQLLRASLIGGTGVDKRIDVIAAAMSAGMTIDDFMDIEIAYAPPYSSPKDLINMIGYRAQ